MKMEIEEPKSKTKKEPSPHQKLKLLKTKAWAWTCAHTLGGSQNPLNGYKLARAANQFLVQNNKVATNDPKTWNSRLKGRQSASESTVESLWSNLQNVYKIGPWDGEIIVRHDPNTNCSLGGYVPLWAALTGNESQIIDSWNNISSQEWDAWLLNYSYDYCEYCNYHRYEELRKLLPSFFSNSVELYRFIINLTKMEAIPPLLALTASLTVARLMKHTETCIYRGLNEDAHYLDIKMRKDINLILSYTGISVEEIIAVAEAYDLRISYFSFEALKELVNIRRGQLTVLRKKVVNPNHDNKPNK